MKIDKSSFHDGCHISNWKNYFEWWYFDFDLKNRHNLHIEWHAPVFNMHDNFCMLIIRNYDGDTALCKEEINTDRHVMKVFRYHRSVVGQNKSYCEIKFPAGCIYERDGNYFINVKEKNLLINIELERILPSIISDDEVIYKAGISDEFLSWNISLPRARAKGQLEMDDKIIEIDGLGYHDHNWGNLNIGRHLSKWIWLRVMFDDFTFIFGDIVDRKCYKKSILLLIDKNGRKIKPDSLELECNLSTNRTDYKISVPEDIIIKFRNKNKYRVHVKADKFFPVREAPLGSFKNHNLNTLVSNSYYLFKLYNLPDFIKKRLGRLLYFQAIVNADLYIDDQLMDTKSGRMEFLVFDE
jgi:hypothetical protein